MCILARCVEDKAIYGRTRSLNLSPSVSAVLHACTKSALAILRVLLELREKDLLGQRIYIVPL